MREPALGYRVPVKISMVWLSYILLRSVHLDSLSVSVTYQRLPSKDTAPPIQSLSLKKVGNLKQANRLMEAYA